MPIRSKSQSRYLNMKFGHGWVQEHGFAGTTKGLPQHVEKDNSGRVNVGLALFRAQQKHHKSKK